MGNSTDNQGNVAAVQVDEGMLATDAVTTLKIKAGEVKTANIGANQVTRAKLEKISGNRVFGNNTSTEADVAEVQVSEGMIANDAVTSIKIKAGEVKESNLASNAVTRDKIQNREVIFNKIQQIGNSTNLVLGYTNANTDVQAVQVNSSMIADNAVTTGKIVDNAVTSIKIAAAAVNTTELAGGAVTEAKIAPGAVTSGKLVGSAVTNEKIANDAVTVDKIANNAVGTNQIANDAVTYGKIQNVVTANRVLGSTAANGVVSEVQINASMIASGVGVVPAGGIIMWSGTTIPAGWALCNGTNGTPNLMDRFIVGSGSTYDVGNIGGSNDATLVSHSHTFSNGIAQSAGAHSHGGVMRYPGSQLEQNQSGSPEDRSNYNQATDSAGAHTHNVTGTISTVGSSATNANLPPYYALAFIMKL